MAPSAPAPREKTWDEEQFGGEKVVKVAPAAKHSMMSIDGDQVDMSMFFDDGGFVQTQYDSVPYDFVELEIS